MPVPVGDGFMQGAVGGTGHGIVVVVQVPGNPNGDGGVHVFCSMVQVGGGGVVPPPGTCPVLCAKAPTQPATQTRKNPISVDFIPTLLCHTLLV